jgi:hypothetical protein
MLLLDLDNNHTREQIAQMSVRECFKAFLHYEGIINYTDLILDTLREIEAAEIRPAPQVHQSLPAQSSSSYKRGDKFRA